MTVITLNDLPLVSFNQRAIEGRHATYFRYVGDIPCDL